MNHHPMQPCWDLAAAAVQAEAIDCALALGLFDALAESQTAQELAARHGLHAANTAHLLELLWSLGLLQAAESRYALAPVARDYLVRGAPGFCGDAWRYRLDALRGHARRLRAQVEHGPQPQAAVQTATGAGWAEAARAQIGQEQRAVSAAGALEIVQRLPRAAQATRLLDLGGGPGWMAIALARRLPRLTGVVFDGPETAAVAQENIDAAGLGQRLRAHGGDVAGDPIGAGFDLVWCSSVLHFVPDIAAVLAKVHAALVPGGLFICVHAERPAEPQEAARVLPYYLPMRLLGRHVLPQGGTAAALARAGFTVVDSFASHQFPMTPVQVVVGARHD